ncbi:hypothetical protein SAMN05518872_10259 [Psychrobacillus sp. OK032]|nr:hypothetical protein SAMN05518872_10259 [Psychrobacillus sp. OK032]
MGIFFEKVEGKKSSKPVFIVRILLFIVMIFCLLMAVMNELDIFYIRIVLIAAGVGSLMGGIESYFQKLDRKVYLSEFSIATVWLLVSFSY